MSEHFITYEQVQKIKVTKKIRIDLLGCPFCGGEAEFREGSSGWRSKINYGVRCKDCKVVSPIRGGEDSQIRAAEVWNKRATE